MLRRLIGRTHPCPRIPLAPCVMAIVVFPALLAQSADGLWGWASNAWSILLLVVGFSLVIFVHELGHFLAAKWAGVRVERFAIGFGKELFGFDSGGTRYSFNVLPLGGYVKMLGQEDFVVDKSGELKVKEDPNSFTNKSIGKRMVIVSAGVIMNLIFAAIAFAIVVMVGRTEPPAIVGAVLADSPAGRAGLQTGDRILSANGKPIRTFRELQSSIVLLNEDEVVLEVERGGRRVEPPPRVCPEYKKDKSVRQVGITPGMNRRVTLPDFHPREEDRPHELQPGDELYQIERDGRFVQQNDLGGYRRAIVEARGRPVRVKVLRPTNPEALTPEMLTAADADIEASPVEVDLRAIWLVAPHEAGDSTSASLLGLVPRLTILSIESGRSFEKAGAQLGDVIVQIGSIAYPTLRQVRELVARSDGLNLPLKVSRPRMSNGDLSWRAVEACVLHREAWIAAGLADWPKVRLLVEKDLAVAELPEHDRKAIMAALDSSSDPKAWRRFLEQADVHTLTLTPRAPFALFAKTSPRVEAMLAWVDEAHLLVADVLDRIGNRPSPARQAEVPIGAIILTAAGQPVRNWGDLNEVFRAHCGQRVELTYRAADRLGRTMFHVPMTLHAALNLPEGARVTRIDGKTAHRLSSGEGRGVEIALPDWRAIEAILSDCVGRTVEVEYVTSTGQAGSGSYAVTKDNIDPWLARTAYQENFICYPLFERHSESNPLTAMMTGFHDAYQATLQTILSIRHIAFTRQVGVDKLSGPVGILRLGSEAADSGVITLLWFLALISANLAVINFLPMPIVDGGLFLFLILEKVRGEPVSIRTQIATQIVGIGLIATLFILVTYQDIKHWLIGT